jgi:hypothetical protein
MKFGKSGLGVVSMVLALAAAPALWAQAGGFGMGRGWGAGGRFGGFRMAQPVTGAPYSAVRTITRVQKLSDGTTITHQSVIQEARDSNGRTYTATQMEGTQGSTGAPRTVYRVFDPVNRETISWSSGNKQASLVHLPDSSQSGGRRMGGAWRASGADASSASPPMHGNAQFKPTVESLGSKTIGGVVADGTRTTIVIPAGREGNDQPITITHETWASSDLKVPVLRIDTDPRFGTSTMELTNINRADPAAGLFQAPAGYTINERNPGQTRP